MMQPYKGVRDFYPEDQRIQNYIFSAMRRAVESYGYEEMNASVLEPTDLYLSKTSEEIVNEQTYTFTDRGERSVTLRPEMTPTVARMVAERRRELGFPLRWYSIQNFFRYERTQRGRLREFWQLNADLFGVTDIESDAEMIVLAHRVMAELGASDKDFVIRIGSREFLDSAYDAAVIPKELRQETTRLLDAMKKSADASEKLEALIGAPARKILDVALSDTDSFKYFAKLQNTIRERGVTNVVVDADIARGFDYYTGMVFEVFDTHPSNPRALFGGGRYDNLIGQYGKEIVPAVGFAMGDVIARDFLETHGLLPKLPSSAHLYLAPITKENGESASVFAQELRESGVNVALGMKHEKIADHIKAAVKLGIPYFAAFGADEASSNTLKIKNLATGEEKNLALEAICSFFALDAKR